MECGCANDTEFCDGCECARDVCRGPECEHGDESAVGMCARHECVRHECARGGGGNECVQGA